MKISIASYTFHELLQSGEMDVFGYLESQKYRYGLQSADIWNGFLKSTDEGYLKQVRRAMDERGLTLVNLAVDGAHIWDEDESVREQNYLNAIRHLKAAEALQAKSIRIDIGGQSKEMTDEQFDFVVKRYREYAQIASDLGIFVGPENHFGPALVPQNIKKIVESVNHPAFRVLLHLGRWAVNPDYGDAVCAPWAMHVHIGKQLLGPNLEDNLRPLVEAGYQGYFGIEDSSGENEYLHAEIGVAMTRLALAHLSPELYSSVC